MKVVMRGSLAQVWGLISGMQLVVHMPLFQIDIPHSTMSVLSELIKVATFDIPFVSVTDIFGEDVFPDPEVVLMEEIGRPSF